MVATSLALTAELGKRAPIMFLCGEAQLPNYNLRLLDGAARVRWGDKVFLGRDPKFGPLISIDPPTDGMGDSAPLLSLTLAPATDADAAELSQPSMQGSRIRIWLGAISRESGQVIPDPYLIFDGELDQPTLTSDLHSRTLEYECVSIFDLFFDNDEGMRLSSSFHRSVWPNEAGMDYMTGIVKQVIWGPGDKVQGSITGA